MGIDPIQIGKFAIDIDYECSGDDGNGIIDTPEEIELFKKKCKTAGFDGVDDVMDTYNKDRYSKEAEYEAKKTKWDSSVETAVIYALTENTALRYDEESQSEAKTIAAGLQKAAKGWWDDEAIAKQAAKITPKNVLDVVEENKTVNALNDGSDETKIQVIEALLIAAAEKQIDVSNIVMIGEDGYKVGRDVPGGNLGEDVLGSRSLGEWISGDDTNFSAVVKALRQALQESEKTMNGENDNKEEMLTTIALRIDADGNGNGYIDTDDEKEAFKQFAATKGYDVDALLEEIADNEANGVENTTDAQKLIFNIFDPTQKARYEKMIDSENSDTSAILEKGFKDINTEVIATGLSRIDHRNVIEVMDGIEDFHDKAIRGFDIYDTLLDNLIQRANKKHINISDIVMKLDDEEYTSNGDTFKLYDKERIDLKIELVKKLQNRIKSKEL